MKRLWAIGLFIMCITLIGCSFEVNTSKGKDKDSEKINGKLTLQILKPDEKAGVTLENNDFYNDVNKYMEANPEMGEKDDFSLYTLDLREGEKGEILLMFLGINRLSMPVTDFSMDVTLGFKDGENVLDNQKVELGTIMLDGLKPNHAVPIPVKITEEQADLYKQLTEDNLFMEIKNFKADEL